MTSRQRLAVTLEHKKPDRIPLDLDGTGQTGINASTLFKLRKEFGLEEKPITIIEPFQMLGEVEQDLRDFLNAAVIGLWTKGNLMGTANENWKPWRKPDETPVLMAGGFVFNTIHNIVAKTPIDNLVALFDEFKKINT